MHNKLVKERKDTQESYLTGPHGKLLKTDCSECMEIIETKDISEIVIIFTKIKCYNISPFKENR